VGKPEGKMRRRWEYIIKVVRKEIGREGVECVNLAGDKKNWRAVVSKVMNLRVH
jgi:hypothetical protein